MQYKMNETPQKFKVTIRQTSNDGVSRKVEAPLPEQFGFTVGSEFSAPFDANSLGGVLQKMKLPFAGQISRKVGVVTTKYYSNPEPTEISFDIEFHAEVSAREEVLAPVVSLMMMSLGTELSVDDVERELAKVAGFGRSILDLVSPTLMDSEGEENEEAAEEVDSEADNSTIIGLTRGGVDEYGDDVLGFIGLLKGPDITSVRFGEVYELHDAWISSVSPQFNNVVDLEGIPLSCTCSVTCILQRDPTTTALNGYFYAR